jgi:hypothetical protein
MNRAQRRHFERRLRKLSEPGTCSLCGSELEHNCSTFSGYDRHGEVALAAQCCVDRLTEIHAMGVFSARRYDFMPPPTPEGAAIKSVPNEKVIDAIIACRKIIAETDKRVDGAERRGGVVRQLGVTVLDYPWKDDDREWFEQNRQRSHRVRLPFPDEADEEVAKTPAGHALIMAVRQVEPGIRIRAGFYLNAELLPAPDDEATAHALFEIAEGREPIPPNGAARAALLEKYRVGSRA